MRCAGHVTSMAEEESCIQFLVGKPEGKSLLEDPGLDGRVILGWIFRKWNVVFWGGLSWPRIGTGCGQL